MESCGVVWGGGVAESSAEAVGSVAHFDLLAPQAPGADKRATSSIHKKGSWPSDYKAAVDRPALISHWDI